MYINYYTTNNKITNFNNIKKKPIKESNNRKILNKTKGIIEYNSYFGLFKNNIHEKYYKLILLTNINNKLFTFIFFCIIFFELLKPILSENENRKLKNLQVINIKVTYGKKIKIINSNYIPNRIFINGVESKTDKSGNVKIPNEGIYNITLEWDKKADKYSKLFQNIASVIDIDFINFDISGIKSIKSMFINCKNLESINFRNFDTSSVTDMASLFEGCNSLKSLDLSNFDTSKVKYMESMFKDCSSLTSLNLINFTTSSLLRMKEIFSGCNSIIFLDLSSFETSSITNMDSIFNDCYSLTSLNITHFITENVVNMNRMFSHCSSLKELDITNLDTSRVTNMAYMFSCCKSLISLNISNFDTSKVEIMDNIFEGCSELTSIDLANFDTSEVISMDGMFINCISLLSLDLSNFSLSQKSMTNFFSGCTSLKTIKFSKEYKLVGNIYHMFYECSSLKSIDLSGFDFALNDNFDSLFYGCYSLTSLDLSKIDSSSVEDMEYMFYGCKSLKSLNIEGLDTSHVTSFYSMFFNCSSLTSLDLSSFNTSLVNDMSYTFTGCQNLRSLNLQSFNTSLVEDMSSMFEGCNYLTSLNISNFDTSSVTKMRSMFFGCNKLTSLDLSNFNTENLVTIEQMFKGCTKLEYINLKNFSDGKIFRFADSFYGVLDNVIYCINNVKESKKILFQLSDKKCTLNDCSHYWKNKRKKMISFKEICIDDCFYDDTYKYEFNNYCYKACPRGSHSSKENIYMCEHYETRCAGKYPFIFTNNKSCSEECNCREFFNNLCTINIYNNLSQSLLISNISNGIQEGLIDNLLEGVINNEGDLIKKEYNTFYQITTSYNYKNNYYDNISSINFGECENILKREYNILKNEALIIFKTDKYFDGLLIPIIEYEVFHPITKEKLNLNHCQNANISIDIYIPVSINDSILFKYNPNSTYYNDICQKNITYIDTDLTLYERKEDFNDNNYCLCQNNCIYKGYDLENKRVICHCQIQDRKSKFSTNQKEDFIFKFLNTKRKANLYILKCYKLAFTKDVLIKNIGNYIIISIIIIYIVSAISVYLKGYNLLLEEINKIIDNKLLEISDIIPKKDNKFENSTDIFSSSDKSKSSHSKLNSNYETKIDSEIIENNNNILNKNKSQKKKEKKIKLDYELNVISYKEAKESDKRTFFQFYLSLIKTKHILFFSFNPKRDYNCYEIKICIFFFNFTLFIFINTLFYNDEMMHKIYQDKGKFNFIYILPQIIYSIIIASFIINLIIKFSSTQQNILDIKHEKNKHNLNARIIIAIKSIKIKLICFFLISIFILILFWYYVTIFCAIYNKTQKYLIKNILVCYLISLIYPFFICLLPSIFRIASLKGPEKCLYKFSQIIEFI